MNRFFISPNCFEFAVVKFDKITSHQIHKVLRLKSGDKVIVLDDSGMEFTVELNQITNDQCVGKILSSQDSKAEPKVKLTLLVGLTQRDKFEWVLQKCTEIGATAFTPVITSRSLVQDIRSAEQKIIRWQSILKEAAEQSGRGVIPILNPPVLYLQALEQLRSHELGMVAYEGENKEPLKKAIRKFSGKNLGIMIGPEGGLSMDEVQRAKQTGLIIVSLGPRILRMETAAVVAAALILHDLRSLD
jgi:16S rRNA (uracil1498-N3)-methyltransferase